MAEAKTIEVEEVPKSDLSRIFNRVDVVKESPSHIYGDSVQVEDMAIFSISPADPVTRDEFKQTMLGYSIIQKEICDSNGIPLSALGEPLKKPSANASKKKHAEYLEQLERIGLSLTQIKQATTYEMTKAETRALIAKCVKIENYKELDGGKLIESKKSSAEILASIPDVFIVWLYDKVQHASNLTTEEVLGL